MGHAPGTSLVNICATNEVLKQINSIAHAINRSRNYVVNRALRQCLEANAWQAQRISEGIADARAGRVHPADDVHAKIAAKHRFGR